MRRMNIIIGLLLLQFNALQAEPITTAFTYQGELKQSNVSAYGTYDFQFEIYAQETDGTGIASIIMKDDVVLEGGVFTVELDFGVLPFTGEQLWLEIGVRPGASVASFSLLTPRQPLNAVPYALYAEFVAMDAVGSEEVNPDQVQLRVDSCPANSSIRIIANDGSVTCEIDDVGLTTVTSTDIVDGTVVAIDVDTTSVQQRVTGTCPADNYLVGVNADGSVICNELPNTPLNLTEDRVVTVTPVGPTSGGFQIDLNGSFTLDGNVSVLINNIEQSLVQFTSNTISFIAPESSGGTVSIVLFIGNRFVPFVAWSVAANGNLSYDPQPLIPYTFEKPTITSIVSAPNNNECVNMSPGIVDCSLSGGASRSIDILGSSFGMDSGLIDVSINGVMCSNVSINTPHTSIQCDLGDELVGCVDCPVIVRVNSQASDEANLVSFLLPSVVDGSLSQIYCTDSLEFPIPCEPGVGNSTIAPAIALTENYGYQVQIVFDVIGLPGIANLANTIVKFGRGESFNELVYECHMVSLNTSTGEVGCFINGFLAAFVGSQNVIGINMNGLEILHTGFTISTPVPSIVDNSVSDSMKPNPSDVINNSTLTTSGDNQLIYFDVDNIGGFPHLVSVFYGPQGGPYLNECNQANIVYYPFNDFNTSIGTVSCYMPASGSNQHFVVQVDNQTSIESNFTVNSPIAPVLTSVFGCVDIIPETTNCPTSGFEFFPGEDAFYPQDITITGQYFPNGVFPLILVGDNICYDVRLNGIDELKCSLPPGTGRQRVNISYPGFFTLSDLYISYAAPTIQSIKGCEDAGTTTRECSTFGGQQISITGANFGASGAQVIIGDNICINTLHDPISPHTRVTCTLPAGSGMDRSVRLISSGSDISNVFSLSYSD